MPGRRGNVHVVITGDADGLDKATRRGEQSFGRLKKGVAVAAAGVAGGVLTMVNTAADFEQQMSSLGSVTNASGRQMRAFRAQALDAGAATKFSASEAAAAQIELAKGGLSIANIMKGGLRSALALAAAGNLELADAASYTANAMNLFGLEGSRSMMVADGLATAANATTADVSDFGIALTQGGGAAKSAGLSFQQTMVALEALAQSGVKGSDAGTSLKAALVQVAGPTEKQASLTKKLGLEFFNAEGRMKPLTRVAATLRDRLGEMGDQQRLATLKTIAGTDGFRALLALYDQGPTRIGKLSKGIQEQGSAARVAARQQDNLRGRLESLSGSIETVAILAGSVLVPPLSEAAGATADFVGGLASGRGPGGEFARTVGHIAGEISSAAATVAHLGMEIGTVGANVAQALAPAGAAIGGFGLAAGHALEPVAFAAGRVSFALAQLGFGLLQSRAGLVALTAVAGALVGRMAALGVAWGVSRVMAFVGSIRQVVATMGVLRTIYVAQTGVTNASTAAVLRYAAASRLAAVANRGLSAAIASTGIGAIAVLAGTAIGALMGMKSATDQNKVSAQDFNAALRAQADAMRAVRDIDIDVAQRKANLRSANVAVEQAQAEVNKLVREGQRGTLEYRAAIANLTQAKVQQRRATRDLGDAEEDARRKRQDATEASQEQANRAKGRIRTLRGEVEALRKAADYARRLAAERKAVDTGQGLEWSDAGDPEAIAAAERAATRLARKQLELARETKRATDATIDVKRQQIEAARASGASQERVRTLKDELGRLKAQSKDGAGRIRDLRGQIARLNGKSVSVDVNLNLLAPDVFPGPAGDGWGMERTVRRGAQAMADKNPLAFMGGLGGGHAGAVDAFTPLAGRFGLAMSSGYRPGSITSSGNLSYHAMNRARDYAGTAAAMLGFARFMAARFGARLKELIYSPLGWSIKNGSRVAPYAVSDHYDHVHVAMRAGGLVPAMLSPGEVGVAPGGGAFRVPGRPVAADTVPMLLPPRTKVLTWHGQQLVHNGIGIDEAMRRQAPHFGKGGQVRPLGTFAATSYGPPWGGIQGGGVTATGVDLRPARQAFGIAVDPSVIRLGSQIWAWPNPFRYRGPFKAFDTGGAIKGNRIDFYDWRGRTAQQGWGVRSTSIYASNPWNGRADQGLTSDQVRERTPVHGRSGLSFEEQSSNADRRLAVAETTAGKPDDRAAGVRKLVLLAGRRRTLSGRLQKVNRALAGKLTPDTRQRLLSDRSSILSELSSMPGEASGLLEGLQEAGTPRRGVRALARMFGIGVPNRPTPMDRAQSRLAQAGLTDDRADDFRALADIRDIARKQYDRALKEGDPRRIAEAANDLKQAADALRDATPGAEDFANRDLALAQLTEGTDDDLAALRRLEQLAQGQLDAALATADPRDDIEAANNLKSVRDSIRQLTDATNQANELAQQRMDLDRQLLQEQQRWRALTETQGPAILGSLIGLVNDGVGRSAQRNSRTPGVAGVPAVYG